MVSSSVNIPVHKYLYSNPRVSHGKIPRSGIAVVVLGVCARVWSGEAGAGA